jgi:hypothetical protein
MASRCSIATTVVTERLALIDEVIKPRYAVLIG